MKNKKSEVINIFNEDGQSLEELIEEILYNYIREKIDNGNI